MNSAISAPGLDALAERLRAKGFAPLDGTDFDTFAATPGDAVILFADDPARGGETWDIAVILPEVLRTLAVPLRAGFLLPAEARKLQPRDGFATWPALLFLRGGQYVGVIEGLRDWAGYCSEIAELLERPASRPPAVGVAVAGGQSANSCH
jgi:hydrogenase-1 operon protein HyaE